LLSARSANPRARHSDNWKCEVLFPTAEWLVGRGGDGSFVYTVATDVNCVCYMRQDTAA